MARETTPSRRWLWVSMPAFYEGVLEDQEHWWTCDPGTRVGDLALLYCTSPLSAIGFLLRVVSPMSSVEHEPQAQENNWSTGCTYKVICEFENPLRIADMQGCRQLAAWPALKRNFHGIAF